MKIKLVSPIEITTNSGLKLELMPVVMDEAFPSKDTAMWMKFIRPGIKHAISGKAVSDLQAYMLKHETEALSEDGELAFTIAGCCLVPCDPELV